ncbi:hypothetical protein GCM10029992_52070 [Glycomyces albus]
MVDESLVDRAAERVLRQKIELGLLDEPAEPPARVDLDPPESRDLAAEIARGSIVLLSNDGALPLGPGARRLAVVGPVADDRAVMLGCYSFPNHHARSEPQPGGDYDRYPYLDLGVEVPSVLERLTADLPGADIEHVAAGTVLDASDADIAAAAEAAARAELALVAVGDRPGMFGRGTTGEGCDALARAPGRQAELLEAVLATGTPTVVLVISGRPYALGAFADRAAAVVQAFLPGQLGAVAISEVLVGARDPEGRLPVGVPARPDSPPATYLAPQLARRSEVSSVDPTPLFHFGHGLSYTEFTWGEPSLLSSAEASPDDVVEIAVEVRNTGDRAGSEVVQVYLHDPVASTVRPVQRLVGFAKLRLEAGQAGEARFAVPLDLAALVGPDGRWTIESGALELRVGRSAADIAGTVTVEVTESRVLEPGTRRLETATSVG